MAEVQYSQGVPDVAPDTSAPQDEQNIQPRAAAGLESLGEGATKAGQFFGQVAANDQFNNVLSGASKLMYGDPSKTTIGPDGQPVQDTGYLGMKGAAALNARPQVEKSLDDLVNAARGNLSTPEQQLQFDSYSRRYRTSLSEQIGSHADQQQSTWFGKVNTDSLNLALDGVSRNPLDGNAVATGAADATSALVKQAIVDGADPNNPNDPMILDAKLKAKQSVLKAQVMAVGATDPAKALSILTKNRDLAGQDFEPLYNAFDDKADAQTGLAAATTAYTGAKGQATQAYAASPLNPAQPVYQQTASAIPGGMSAGGLARLVQAESNGKDVTNKYGYTGYAQFGSAEWKEYGAGGSPHDLGDSVAAAQRYAVANAKILSATLGRSPTDAELYLAHQQGAGGASALLTNPNAPASQVLGSLARVRANLPASLQGQAATMTAGQFASYWTHKFNGTVPSTGVAAPEPGPRAALAPAAQNVPANAVAAAVPGAAPTNVPAPLQPDANPLPAPEAVGENPASAKATAYQEIMSRDDLTPKQKDIALSHINQMSMQDQIASDATATQIKQANDKAMNDYTTQILQGNFPPVTEVANSPYLTAEGKKSITDMMLQHADMSAAGASQAYGSGFYRTMGQVIAQPGDPSRLSDPTQIYALAGPGGSLTLAGAQKLVGIMSTTAKSVEDTNTTEALHSLISGQKSKMSFQQDTGPVQIKDPEGEHLFNSRFVPKVMGAYDQWIKAGKDPWAFLTQKNFDDLAQGLRSPREMAMAQLSAQQTGLDTSQIPAPPAPEGADPNGWKLVVTSPPIRSNGKPWPVDNWAQVVSALKADPTPDVMRQFDEKFASSNITAEGVLSVITPQTDQPMTEWPKFSDIAAPAAEPNAAAPPPPVIPGAYNPVLPSNQPRGR